MHKMDVSYLMVGDDSHPEALEDSEAAAVAATTKDETISLALHPTMQARQMHSMHWLHVAILRLKAKSDWRIVALHSTTLVPFKAVAQ